MSRNDRMCDRDFGRVQESDVDFPNIPKKTIYAPETDFSKELLVMIQKTGSDVNISPQTAQSSSNSNLSFNVIFNNETSIIDRHIPLQLNLIISGTGPAPLAGNLLLQNQGIFALRSWPLAHCMTDINIKVNDQSFSTQPQQFIQALQHAYIGQDDNNLWLSTFPSLPDNYQTYAQGLGANNNPLNGYESSSYWANARGTFPYTVLVNTPTAFSIQYTITEPLIVPPLLINPKNRENGFGNLSQLLINIQFSSLLRAFSYDEVNGNPLTTLTATITGTPQLLIKQITPSREEPMPMYLNLSYDVITTYPTQFNQTVLPGAIYEYSSINAIQLNQVPKKIYIWSGYSQSNYDSTVVPGGGYSICDSFSELLSLSITFNNKTGILSSATEQDLFLLSKKNGINVSWPQWTGAGANNPNSPTIGLGSVLCLKFDEDIGLPDDLAPSVSEKFNFQLLNSRFRNINPNTITPTLYVTFCYDGAMTLTEGRCYQFSPMLTKQDAINAPIYERAQYSSVHDMMGGDFYSGVKRFFNNAAPVVRKIREAFTPVLQSFLPQYSSQIGQVSKGLEQVGLGGRYTNSSQMRRQLTRGRR